ncbi:MAG: ribosome maturation factor RimM [Chloroflexota bacterium]|nr:ribosome maturation factor RimM [Chloroflexota bacterium]
MPVPEIAASGPNDAPQQRQRSRRPAARRAPRIPRTPPRLADTAGPDPATPLARARLVVGTILAPHGLNGEFKLRLQTNDPEHLLTLKRLHLGDEPAPRTVLSARMHQGNALMRLQGISSPETVERLRGSTLSIRASDARPLAPNEYFLFQIIGLEVFTEAGERLGKVTDLMETGANDVLVVTPDEGPDILLPSHPDVVVSLDPADGKVIVRPLSYYGE